MSTELMHVALQTTDFNRIRTLQSGPCLCAEEAQAGPGNGKRSEEGEEEDIQSRAVCGKVKAAFFSKSKAVHSAPWCYHRKLQAGSLGYKGRLECFYKVYKPSTKLRS